MSAIYYDQFIIHQNDQNFLSFKGLRGPILYLLGTYKSMEPGGPTHNDTSTKTNRTQSNIMTILHHLSCKQFQESD